MRFGHRFESRYYQKSTLSENLIVAWPLDEASGTRYPDYGGTEFNLTDVNTVGTADAPPGIGGLEFVVRRAAVQALVQRREYAEAWSKYLQLEDARRLNPAVGQITDEQRAVARRMLVRLDATNLNDRQQSYLRDPVFDHWRRALRTFAQEPLDVPAMIAALERFELELSDRDSTDLARGFQILHWSPRPEETRFAEPLNDHYRNANVRVAIAGDLINRLLHEPRSVDEPVNDMIRDAHMYGHSHTSARVRVELLPDRRQLARKNLERVGLASRVDFKLRDIQEGLDEADADAFFLDVQNPYDYIAQVRTALKRGGFFCSLVPTFNQVERTLHALRHNKFAFLEVCEILLRYYKAGTEPPASHRPNGRTHRLFDLRATN